MNAIVSAVRTRIRFSTSRPSFQGLPLLGALVLGTVLAWGSPEPATAQYFGQNQVRWDRFDFQVLETDHFRIYYYPETDEAVRETARVAERWHERLARVLSYELPERNPLILYADHPDFQQTNVVQGQIGESTGGVTEGLRQRMVLPLTDALEDTHHVLGHELVHAFQFSMASRGLGISSLLRQPLWVVEGLAEYLSVGRADTHTAMWLRDALLQEDFPTIRDLGGDPRRYFPYRFGHSFWAFVASRWGDEIAVRVFTTSLELGMGGAIEDVLGLTRSELSEAWAQAVHAEYGPALEGRSRPEDVGEPIVTPEGSGGGLNLAPSVSPDGRRVAFLSERGVFSIELWLADAETGEIIRRLVTTETDPHLDALSFVQSAGTWSPDGKRFGFIVFSRGDNRIVTVDAETGGNRREYAVPEVGAIHHPAWSPDGSHIAFAGQSGGRSDLWLLDVETGEASRLTDDDYSVLQPAWSPTGEAIAFVTERGEGTNLERLEIGPLRLALMELDTREVALLRPFPTGKAINPAFSPDGSSLYFIADPDGFSDIYRLDLGTGDAYRVTRVATGISGLSSRSTALSVAQDDGRLAFSVFSGGDYSVHTLPASEAVGEPMQDGRMVVALPGALPITERAEEGFVMTYLRDPSLGLVPRPTQEARPYRAGLDLEFIGPINIGVGADQFGAVAGGSVSAVFSDLLRRQNLQLAMQAQGELADIGGQVFYLNESGRWSWGGLAGRVPYRTGFVQTGAGPEGTTQVDQIIQRVTTYQVAGLAFYPFSRVRRAEFMAGAAHQGYDAERWTWLISGNRIVEQHREDAPQFAPESVTLYQGSAALVGDNSVMGFVSPVRGQRWRMEVQPTFGSLQYTTGLADYRRYLGGRPVTLAGRAFHLGRYGEDAENRRLNPLFLGYETLVRGYSSGSFQATECGPSDSGGCPEFDRLVGSRVAVANLELRLPLFGVEGYGLFTGSPFPLEIGAFLDGGVAWTSDESPELTWATRSAGRLPVFSTGFTSRLGLGRYLAIEVYWAYPFQRPERGGHFGFALSPGF